MRLLFLSHAKCKTGTDVLSEHALLCTYPYICRRWIWSRSAVRSGNEAATNGQHHSSNGAAAADQYQPVNGHAMRLQHEPSAQFPELQRAPPAQTRLQRFCSLLETALRRVAGWCLGIYQYYMKLTPKEQVTLLDFLLGALFLSAFFWSLLGILVAAYKRGSDQSQIPNGAVILSN